MKRLTAIISALALMLGMAQCKKNVEQITAGGETPSEGVYVTLTAGLNGAKTEIGTTGIVKWKANDKLYVVGETQGLLGSITTSTGGAATATFSGVINPITAEQYVRLYYVGDKTFTLDDSGNYTFGIGTQDGTLAGIASNNQIMYGKSAEKIGVGEINLGSVSMVSLMSIAHLNITANSSAVGATTVTGGFASSTFNAKTYDGAALSGTPGNIAMTFTSPTVSTNCYIALLPGTQTLTFRGVNDYMASLEEKTVVANKFYNSGTAVAVNMVTVLPPGALSGLFTVSMGSDGQAGTIDDVKVRFSKGNLQYLGQAAEGSKWRFADNQYDVMGDGPLTGTENQGNVDLGSAYTGKYNTASGNGGPNETNDDKAAARDLFGWGATGTQDSRTVSSGYQNNYNPYSTSKSLVGSGHPAYNINRYGYGPDYDETNEYGLSVTYGSDWGSLFNTDTENMQNTGWRTLTKDECYYMLEIRKVTVNGSKKYPYGQGVVNGVKGALILPDDWDGSVCPDFDYDASSFANVFNADSTPTWAQMEEAGVVFLPAAGSRLGTNLDKVNTQGYYWFSTCINPAKAQSLFIQSYDVVEENSLKFGGRSVRLVR